MYRKRCVNGISSVEFMNVREFSFWAYYEKGPGLFCQVHDRTVVSVGRIYIFILLIFDFTDGLRVYPLTLMIFPVFVTLVYPWILISLTGFTVLL